ncbi:MAG: fatty acid--CoA ligase family protein [Acidobacteriota bacterium]
MRTAAETVPDRAALITHERVVSWAELASMALGTVREVQRSPSMTPVVVRAGLDVESLVLIHGLIATGTPMLLLHPRAKTSENERIISACQAIEGPFEGVDSNRHRVLETLPDDERPLAIIPTSGTSGAPKGVVLSRRAFAASARASATNLGWREDDRWWLTLPLAHVGGLSVVTRCLQARRPIVLESAPRFDPLWAIDVIERQRVTLLSLVPTMLERLLDHDWRPPSHLRAVLVGGAASSPALLARARQQGVPVLTTYGLSEACSQVATESPDDQTPRPLRGCGRPLPGIDVRIAIDGVIEIGGPTLFSGYAPSGGESWTADGWLRTRDLGTFDANGILRVLGRSDSTIITGGENVVPGEVETVLEAHPSVRSAVVVGVAEPTWGQLVTATVVLASSTTDTDQPDLVLWCRDRLASFKCPRFVAIRESLPLGPTGKVDRRAVAEWMRSRVAGDPNTDARR